ncbi:MAG: glycoside hydrolase family 5 protein [Myxococcales bacterium]|nr:MAG: glycoside hydrolase family 5 protein [Myxococcales bacterium]
MGSKFGFDYFYPQAKHLDYYLGKGLTTIRLPFRWKRLQHEQKAALDPTELGRLDAVVKLAGERGMRLILDPHDYASYDGDKVGSPEVPNAAFADFWSKLAKHYKDNPLIVFGLMNEPSKMKTEQWLGAANAAIAAIRKAGATNLILVPGNGYTGAGTWDNPNAYGSPNSKVMLDVVDPGNNFVFELHTYFDEWSSGTEDTCKSKTIGSERLKKVTGWLREHGYRGFLGEFGIPYNETCYAALDDLLSYIDDNRDVWLGWTYFAGGYAMHGYHYSVEPEKSTGKDRPPMKYLEQHAKLARSPRAPVRSGRRPRSPRRLRSTDRGGPGHGQPGYRLRPRPGWLCRSRARTTDRPPLLPDRLLLARGDNPLSRSTPPRGWVDRKWP